MPPSLSVDLKREFRLSIVLEDAAALLRDLWNLKSKPSFKLIMPPGFKGEVPDIAGQILGLGFRGVYVQLEDDSEVLVGIGVINTMTHGRPPLAYFAGGRSTKVKALVAALAIAVARLVGSSIEDGSGHWMPREEFAPEELRLALMQCKPSGSDDCR